MIIGELSEALGLVKGLTPSTITGSTGPKLCRFALLRLGVLARPPPSTRTLVGRGRVLFLLSGKLGACVRSRFTGAAGMDIRFCRARILALRSICGCRPLERFASDFQMASAVGLPNRGCWWSVLLAMAAICATRAMLRRGGSSEEREEEHCRVHDRSTCLCSSKEFACFVTCFRRSAFSNPQSLPNTLPPKRAELLVQQKRSNLGRDGTTPVNFLSPLKVGLFCLQPGRPLSVLDTKRTMTMPAFKVKYQSSFLPNRRCAS